MEGGYHSFWSIERDTNLQTHTHFECGWALDGIGGPPITMLMRGHAHDTFLLKGKFLIRSFVEPALLTMRVERGRKTIDF